MPNPRNLTKWAVCAASAFALASVLAGQKAPENAALHFDGHRFHQAEPRTVGFSDWAKRTLTSRRGPWRHFTNTPPGPPPAPSVSDGGLRVTFVNHATLLIQIDGVNILTDPTWAERSVPIVGVKRRRPPGLRFEDLPPIDAVLV